MEKRLGVTKLWLWRLDSDDFRSHVHIKKYKKRIFHTANRCIKDMDKFGGGQIRFFQQTLVKIC